MRENKKMLWMGAGMILGAFATCLLVMPPKEARAANDRYEDYILCTGAVTTTLRTPTDGVWLLDYRAGKLMGTVIDRGTGTIVGWADVDLVSEFQIAPRQNVHFMMTTGQVAAGQAALYVAETTTGKIGVYTMGQRPDGQPGVQIKRHDIMQFRPAAGAAKAG